MTTESKLQMPNGGWVKRASPTEPIPNRALWKRGRGHKPAWRFVGYQRAINTFFMWGLSWGKARKTNNFPIENI